MKVYAIKDRMLDYFEPPFIGQDDNQVQSAVARAVNNGEVTNAIAQAPHHFELWSLGEVLETGHITAQKEFICDCSSLIRRGVRAETGANPGDRETPTSEISRHRAPEDIGADSGANPSSIQASAPTTPRERPEAH